MINHVSAMRPLQKQCEKRVAYPDDSYYVFFFDLSSEDAIHLYWAITTN